MKRGKLSPKCLQFSFKSDTPVYPMRLTGAGATGSLNLRLFIAGPGTAKADNLQLIASTKAELEHLGPGLSKLVSPKMQLTALEGRLSIQEMQKDIPISFTESKFTYLVKANPQKRNSTLFAIFIILSAVLSPWYKKQN